MLSIQLIKHNDSSDFTTSLPFSTKPDFDILTDGRSATSISTTLLFEKLSSSSSSEQAVNLWSSLIELTNKSATSKSVLYERGLYDPGSGEVCAKYVAVSDSDVVKHVYYNYPPIKDPGIAAALFKPEPTKKYSGDGQELYLDLCKEMNIAPVRSFYRGLLNKEINLKYYGLNSAGLRPMCLALINNKCVLRLDLTDNWLDHDACFHLGQLLRESFALQELVLAGCKIGPEGLLRLLNRMDRELLNLNLSNNDIGDAGIPYLANTLLKGTIIKRLDLSRNNLTSESGSVLAQAFEYNGTVTHLNLSWNKIFHPKDANALFRALSVSNFLTELNFSWNGLSTSTTLANILCMPTLQVLDLSNNRLSTDTIRLIAANLKRGKLRTLDLSYNPMTSSDAMMMLKKLSNQDVKLRKLYMQDTPVTKAFKLLLEKILSLSYRKKKTTVKYGRVLKDYSLLIPDLKVIVMKRLDFITSNTKCRMDIREYFLQARTTKQFMEACEMQNALKLASIQIDEDFMDQFIDCFPGPLTQKGKKSINLDDVVEYIRRLWPEKKAPIPPLRPVSVKFLKPVTVLKKGKKKK